MKTGLIGRLLYGESVDVTKQRAVKFFPGNPPRKGDTMLVDGRRVRVTHSKVKWDGPQWTLRSLWVRPTTPPKTTL